MSIKEKLLKEKIICLLENIKAIELTAFGGFAQ